MSTFYVRKNGSGTHTTIQSAFIQAVSGDVIDVEAGLFEENVDFYKSGITLKGAGKNLTEIRGVQESNVTKSCTFTSGSTTLNISAGTSGWLVGRYIQGTGLATGTRIVSVSPTSVTISAATTSARTNQSIVMVAVPSTIVVRGVNHTIKDLKITAVQASDLRCLSDNAAIFFRTAGFGEVAASGYILENCIIEARGESAIMTDAASGVGNGIIRNNTVQGKTFVGASAAQVPAFGTMTKSGTVLSNRTIEFSDLSGITAPNAVNTQGSEINPGLRVSAINGNIVTVTANIPDAVGTTRNFSFANVQFNYPNVARQLVVVQGVNQSTQFLNNTVNGVTGSGISYNTAVTVDTANAVITGNTLNGEFKYGYALRARGVGATVSNNTNYSLPGNENAGFLIGPTGSQTAGMNIGTNTSIVSRLVESTQSVGNSFVSFTMSKNMLKSNSIVSSHPVFSDESNWKLVNFVYKHTSSARRLVASFRSFEGSKKAKLKANMSAGDGFELHKIIISKADRTHLVLKRSQISDASGFDFNLLNDGPSSGENPGQSVNWDFASLQSEYYSLNAQNELVSNFSTLPPHGWMTGPWMLYSTDSYAIGNNGLEITVKGEHGIFNVGINQFLGVCDVDKSIFSGFSRSETGENQPSVQSNSQNQYYAYPSSSPNNEVTFKLVIKLNETLFYINGELVHTRPVPVLNNATASTLVKLCTRFIDQHKIKQVSVVSL